MPEPKDQLDALEAELSAELDKMNDSSDEDLEAQISRAADDLSADDHALSRIHDAAESFKQGNPMSQVAPRAMPPAASINQSGLPKAPYNPASDPVAVQQVNAQREQNKVKPTNRVAQALDEIRESIESEMHTLETLVAAKEVELKNLATNFENYQNGLQAQIDRHMEEVRKIRDAMVGNEGKYAEAKQQATANFDAEITAQHAMIDGKRAQHESIKNRLDPDRAKKLPAAALGVQPAYSDGTEPAKTEIPSGVTAKTSDTLTVQNEAPTAGTAISSSESLPQS